MERLHLKDDKSVPRDLREKGLGGERGRTCEDV